MLTLIAAAALLPLYPQAAKGAWSYNKRFSTELYTDKQNDFCLLRSAIDLTSNGIEFRLGISFGSKNEISLSTMHDGITPRGPIRFIVGAEEYVLEELSKEAVGSATVMRWTMSRPMMTKLLKSLKAADSAVLLLPVLAGNMEFPVPTARSEDTFAGAESCEDYRLGKVLG